MSAETKHKDCPSISEEKRRLIELDIAFQHASMAVDALSRGVTPERLSAARNRLVDVLEALDRVRRGA